MDPGLAGGLSEVDVAVAVRDADSSFESFVVPLAEPVDGAVIVPDAVDDTVPVVPDLLAFS